MKSLPLLAVALLACKSSPEASSPTPPVEPVAKGSAEPSPWDTTAMAPDHATAKVEPKPPEDPKVVAERALKRIPEIKKHLSALRNQPFRIDVPAEYQTTADFRTFVEKEIGKELGGAKAKAMVDGLLHIGFLKERIDLGKAIADTMVTQAAAYYDPAQKKYFLVMTPSDDNMLDTITAHELTHALQDQYFDLTKYLEPNGKKGPALSADEQNARKFVVEGEATFAMFAYLITAKSGSTTIDDKTLRALKLQLKLTGNLSIDELRKMTKAQAEGLGGSPEMKASAEAMDKIPAIILVPMVDSYLKGAMPSVAAFEKGGWDEVAKLFTSPPQSTEQVLHPDTKLFPRDMPQTTALPKQAGMTLIDSDVIGELGWRVYLEQWGDKTSNDDAAGWDGDRYAVWRAKDGSLLGLIATTWDSEKDAQEFEAAYRASLITRFGGDGSKRSDGHVIVVSRQGNIVVIVDGSTNIEAATAAATVLSTVKFTEVK
jgi:hypothetical protein